MQLQPCPWIRRRLRAVCARLIAFCGKQWPCFFGAIGFIVRMCNSGTLIWDDVHLARNSNPFIKSPAPLHFILFLDSFSGCHIGWSKISPTWWITFSGTPTAGFHLSNILLHLNYRRPPQCRLLALLFGKGAGFSRTCDFLLYSTCAVTPPLLFISVVGL